MRDGPDLQSLRRQDPQPIAQTAGIGLSAGTVPRIAADVNPKSPARVDDIVTAQQRAGRLRAAAEQARHRARQRHDAAARLAHLATAAQAAATDAQAAAQAAATDAHARLDQLRSSLLSPHQTGTSPTAQHQTPNR